MRKVFIGLLAMVSATTLAATSKPALPAPKQLVEPLNKVIVIVNGQPVTQHQFDQFVERSIKRLQMTNRPMPPIDQFREYLLKQYVDRVLELQLAKNFNITVSAKQVQQQIDHIMTGEHLTLPQLKQHVYLQGYTYDEFKQEVKDEITLGKLQQQIAQGQINVTDADIDAALSKLKADKRFAKQYHVIDILTPVDEEASKAQLARALTVSRELKAHLQKGISYKKVADKNDTDLGWRTLNDMPDIFAKQVTNLKTNEVAGPIKAANGYHVIQLVGERQSQQKLPSRDQIRQQLFMKQVDQHVEKWLKSMRKQANIEYIKDKDAQTS